MGFCSGMARILLIIFNFVFWLSGAAILGVGIWILVDPDLKDYLDVIKDATDDAEFIKIAAYILIGFGSFVFLVGFCGCCGAIRNSKCLIGMYIFFLVLVFAGELAAGIYCAIYQGETEDKLKDGLQKSIKNNYGRRSIDSAWDVVQKELDCCGAVKPSDYENSYWVNQTAGDAKIPVSCCILKEDGKPIDQDQCQKMTGQFHDEGCYQALKDWMEDKSTVLIGVGCGIAALQIIGLVCAVCFCRHMDEEKYQST